MAHQEKERERKRKATNPCAAHLKMAPMCPDSIPRFWWPAPRVCPTPQTSRIHLNRCQPARDCCQAPVHEMHIQTHTHTYDS